MKDSKDFSSDDGGDVEFYFDTIIIGAGISGINAAYRIQTDGPADMSYAILEGRDSLGGTWDLFRYPGIRSDSDMFTFGFPWNPWTRKESLAAGPQLRKYITESAQSQGIDHHILYRHHVLSGDWSSGTQNWVFQVSVPGHDDPVIFRSRFVLLGTGYYDYEQPLETVIPGIENFAGKVIHPQFWPKDYDYTDKRVVVIGSGATAVTIVPSMAGRAKQVTMLQRSPSYVFSLWSNGFWTALMFSLLPARVANYINRVIWLWRSYLTTLLCRTWPGIAKIVIKHLTIKQLPPDVPWDPHFKPRYNPWEQRFCACADGDFFAALRSGKANVVTGRIKSVREKTIEMESGDTVGPVDAIVTATGLKLRFGGGVKFSVDGKPFRWADKFAWRAAMLEDVPNLLFLTGYETTSWTLGADISSQLFVRILRTMQAKGATVVVPRPSRRRMAEKPMMSLNSTYLRNIRDVLPKGGEGVWSPKSNYFVDLIRAKWGSPTTDLEFK
jgi:cation diffusion facilitator CzcD-associated flavoprotein CzcO